MVAAFHAGIGAGGTLLVRGDDLGSGVAVEIGDRDADERAAGRGIGRNLPSPAPASNGSPWVLKVKQMSLFTGCDDVGETIRIEVRHSEISRASGLGALGQREAEPFVGIV